MVEKHKKKRDYYINKYVEGPDHNTLMVQLIHPVNAEGPKPLSTCNLPKVKFIPISLQGNL